jgi:hypothetical protein
MAAATKRCVLCKQDLPPSEFAAGRHQCKECIAGWHAAYRILNKTAIAARRQKWREQQKTTTTTKKGPQ